MTQDGTDVIIDVRQVPGSYPSLVFRVPLLSVPFVEPKVYKNSKKGLRKKDESLT